MTFVKPVCWTRTARDLTTMILTERNPNGCNGKPDRECPWCREYPKVYRRVSKLLDRLREPQGERST
jgi:hypothetical protein